jgi:hypothetical protein
MQFEGVTVFINSDLVRQVDQRASLRDFAGVIVLCLARKVSRELSIAEIHEVATQLRALNIIPQTAQVEHIGIGCNRYGIPGLIVNYTDGPR